MQWCHKFLAQHYEGLGFEVDFDGPPPYRIAWPIALSKISIVYSEEEKLGGLVKTGKSPIVVEE